MLPKLFHFVNNHQFVFLLFVHCVISSTFLERSHLLFQQEDVSVQLEALDILADLLSRFGGLLLSFHATILEALLPQLSSPRQAVRKRYVTISYPKIIRN